MSSAEAAAPEAAGSDPLSAVADAMRKAASAATNDAASLRAKLGNAGPEIANAASRAAYTGSYMISYGLVYAAVFIAKSVPQENPFVRGLKDGASAAIDAVNEAKGIGEYAAPVEDASGH